MDLAMTTDYLTSHGEATPHLRRIAEAGFTHVHWGHESNTDHVYSPAEISAAGATLARLDLQLQDLHASHGVERCWAALDEDRRRAGVGLIENRILMAASLAGRVVILHIPPRPPDEVRSRRFSAALRRSLDELEPVARSHRVRLALENAPADDFAEIHSLLASYPPDLLGICYDSGHGHIGGAGLDHLERQPDRLLAVHLHDNDGAFDLHALPFTGTVDWVRLAELVRGSAYQGCVTLEARMRGASTNSDSFLAEARAVAARLAKFIRGEAPDDEPTSGNRWRADVHVSTRRSRH